MNRRHFILCAAALALLPAPVAAAPFSSARLTVETRGAGADVILIPGLGTGRNVWSSLVRAVPGYRYHLVQLAGFAGEPVRGNARGPVVAPLARELARYIEESGLRRPAIVGHSMGGTLAMLLAAGHPRLVGRIMVVDMLPAPAGLFGQNREDTGALARGIASLTGTEAGRRLYSSFVNVLAPQGSGFRTSDPALVGRTMNELVAMDLTDRLPAIRVPFTIVYAAPDERLARAADRRYRSAYANARSPRFVRIDDSGHMIMFDQPARLAAAIREFLR